MCEVHLEDKQHCNWVGVASTFTQLMNNQIIFSCPANRGCTKVDECDRSCKNKKTNGHTIPSKLNSDAGKESEFEKLKKTLRDFEQPK